MKKKTFSEKAHEETVESLNHTIYTEHLRLRGEIEEMRRKGSDRILCDLCGRDTQCECYGYNKALSDVLKLLSSEPVDNCSECETPDDEITGCEVCHRPTSYEEEPEP